MMNAHDLDNKHTKAKTFSSLLCSWLELASSIHRQQQYLHI